MRDLIINILTGVGTFFGSLVTLICFVWLLKYWVVMPILRFYEDLRPGGFWTGLWHTLRVLAKWTVVIVTVLFVGAIVLAAFYDLGESVREAIHGAPSK